MSDDWKSVLNEIERSVSPSVFSTWFSDISLVSIDDGIATIGASNTFKKSQLESKYLKTIKNAFLKTGVNITDIIFTITQSSEKPKVRSREVLNTQDLVTKIKMIKKPVSSSFETGLNERYSMENFVTGSNNDLAVSVAKNVIDFPGKRYNPFFLYGGPGLGKTHLVQAIGNALHKKDPSLKILYTPISHFYSEYIASVRKDKFNDFYKKYQNLDVLIIDDIQMIMGKDGSQQQFFNIFNDLYNLNKQIIITSDKLPEQIKSLDERLSTRLAMAGAIDLQMPNFEDRCAILKAWAEFDGFEVEDEVIEFIADSIKTNIRDLEREFKQILAISEFRKVSPLQIIEDGYVSMLAKTSRPKTATSKQIVDKVAKYYNLSSKELKSRNRSFNIKNARQVAMFFLSKELSLSTNKIAQEVGVKDHSTVMHGIKKIETEMKDNFALRDEIEDIKELIYA